MRISRLYRLALALVLALMVFGVCRTHAYAAPYQWPWTSDPKRCGATDAWACATYAIYTVQTKTAEVVWQGDRLLLILARYIETVREWLVNDVLGNIFDSTVRGLQFPFWISVGIAWIAFVGSKMLIIVGDFNWVDLRKALKYIALSLFIFHVGSSAMSGLEQLRLSGSTFFASMAEASSSTALKINSDPEPDAQMPMPKSLYSSSSDADSACNTDLRRKNDNGIHLNDYTGNYLLAQVKDVHCPGEIADRPNLPEVFARGGDYNGTSFNGYFPAGDFDTKDDTTQQKWMSLATTAITRLALGVPLGIAAIFEQTLNLVYALGLVALCFGATISLLVALFIPGEALFKNQIDALFKLYKNSWMSALWIGILLVVIDQGASKGSSLTVAAFGVVAALVSGALLLQGIKSTATTFAAMSEAMGGAPAAIVSAGKGLGKVAMDSALIGGALATGGAGMLASTAIRRAGRDLGASSLGRAAGRTFTNATANSVNAWDAERLDNQMDKRESKELAWYESRSYAQKPLDAAQQQRVAALQTNQTQRDVRRSQQQAAKARTREDFATADAFVQTAAAAQAGTSRQERSNTLLDAGDVAYGDGRLRGGGQLYKEGTRLAKGTNGSSDPKDVNGSSPTSTDSTTPVADLRRTRNTALRNKRWDEAHQAIAQIRQLQGSEYIPPTRMQRHEEQALNKDMRDARARGDTSTAAVLHDSQKELQADMRMTDARPPTERAAQYQARITKLKEAADEATSTGNTEGARQLTKAAHRIERQLGQSTDTTAQQQWNTAVDRGDTVAAMQLRPKIAEEYYAQTSRQRPSPTEAGIPRRSAMGSSVTFIPTADPMLATNNSSKVIHTTTSTIDSTAPASTAPAGVIPVSTAPAGVIPVSAAPVSAAPDTGRIRAALPSVSSETSNISTASRPRTSTYSRPSIAGGGQSRVMDTNASPLPEQLTPNSVSVNTATPPSPPAAGTPVVSDTTGARTPLEDGNTNVTVALPSLPERATIESTMDPVPSSAPAQAAMPVVDAAPLRSAASTQATAGPAPMIEAAPPRRAASTQATKSPSLSQQMLQAAITPSTSTTSSTPEAKSSPTRATPRPSGARMTKSRVSVPGNGTKKD